MRGERLGRLGIPLAIAFTLAACLQEFLGFSRLTAIPCGLWVAVQINNNIFAPAWQLQEDQAKATTADARSPPK